MGEKQGRDVVILDLRPVSLLADFFVMVTADSPRQMRAVMEAAVSAARDQAGARVTMSDGTPESGWVLLDFGDVIAHVFDAERRAFYDLEAMWDKATLVARMA